MQLLINPASELPIYRQIMHEIIQAIAGGRLKPGDKLPSHRDLAEELIIAPLTVKKAYDMLDVLGYLETQRGRGTFIAAQLPVIEYADRRRQIIEAARKLLSDAYLGGFAFEDVIEILKEADRELVVGRHQSQP
jgi:GntR family transcriptional regulator